METKRLQYIDYSKAFVILIVLIAHLEIDNPNMPLFSIMPLFFIMPLLFIVSGFTFKLKDKTFKGYTISKFFRLLLPFWIIMLIDIPLDIVRAYYYNYGTYEMVLPALINTIYGSGAKVPDILGIYDVLAAIVPAPQPSEIFADVILPTNCHLWFLPAMFAACIIFFAVMKYFGNNKTALAIISLLLVFAAAVESLDFIPQYPYGIGRGCIGAAFMIFGCKLSETQFFEKSTIAIKAAVMIAGAAVFILLVEHSHLISIMMVMSYYGDAGIWSVYLMYAAGIICSLTVIMFFYLLEKFGTGKAGNLLSLIGQNTMGIYVWQFFIFFAMDVLFFSITNAVPEPDIYFTCCLPKSAILYKIIEIAAVVAVILIVKQYSGKIRAALKLRG